jgi:hypothetical protein
MAYIVLTLSIAIAVLGTVGIFVPTALLAISRPFLTPAGLYAAAAIRLVLGTALFLAAPTSRAPKALRVLGVVVVVAGVVTPLVGVERARAIVAWWTDQGTAFLRLWAGLALALGTFLAYVTVPRRDRT